MSRKTNNFIDLQVNKKNEDAQDTRSDEEDNRISFANDNVHDRCLLNVVHEHCNHECAKKLLPDGFIGCA